MVTFGTSLRPGNIQATMMIDTIGLGIPKIMVPVQVRMATMHAIGLGTKKMMDPVQVRMATISNLAGPTKKIIIVTTVSTLGGNIQMTNIILHPIWPQEQTLSQELPTRSLANAQTSRLEDSPRNVNR